jgi:hypothetical protein
LHSLFAKAFDGGVLLQSYLRNRDSDGGKCPPIFSCLMDGNIEIVRLLISSGADVNAGCT